MAVTIGVNQVQTLRKALQEIGQENLLQPLVDRMGGLDQEGGDRGVAVRHLEPDH